MARAIDADRLADGLKLHRQPTDQKHEADRQWAVGYNAGLDRALHSIAYAPTLTQPNEPLTLDELGEMSYTENDRLKEEVQQMRWIPVEERLPEEIGNYLVVVCDEHLPRDERIWNGTIMGEGFYGEEDWDMEYSGYIHDVTGMVTHWMPFPNFPEEEPNGKK